MKKNHPSLSTGFTLIELLVVIGLIAVLSAVVLVAVNPARQFAQARDAQRIGHLNAILNAIGQNIVDNKGTFTCAAGTLPTSAVNMSSRSADYDIRPCLIPTYIAELPVDPSSGQAYDSTKTPTYDAKYTIFQDATTKRVTVTATDAEIAKPITATR